MKQLAFVAEATGALSVEGTGDGFQCLGAVEVAHVVREAARVAVAAVAASDVELT